MSKTVFEVFYLGRWPSPASSVSVVDGHTLLHVPAAKPTRLLAAWRSIYACSPMGPSACAVICKANQVLTSTLINCATSRGMRDV